VLLKSVFKNFWDKEDCLLEHLSFPAVNNELFTYYIPLKRNSLIFSSLPLPSKEIGENYSLCKLWKCNQ